VFIYTEIKKIVAAHQGSPSLPCISNNQRRYVNYVSLVWPSTAYIPATYGGDFEFLIAN